LLLALLDDAVPLSPSSDWLCDPSALPHQVDFPAGNLIVLPTGREQIEAASFLDGRSNFSTGSPFAVPLDHVMASELPSAGTRRYIFHIGFCGSTFLSRLIESPGHSVVLREPNALAGLANVRAALDRGEGMEDRFPATLDAIQILLNRPWSEGVPVVIKPSNWVNNLLPDLCADPDGTKPLFLTIERGSFLKAVLRGGSSRLAFAARAAVHLSSRHDQDAVLVNKALAEGTDIQKLTRLTLVLHHIQLQSFARAARAGGWGAAHMLTFEQLQADPVDAGQRAASALDISLPIDNIAQNHARWSSSNAKNPSLAYSQERERHSLIEIDDAQGDDIRRAMEWAGDVL
jgi:hypothetical protein